jgi:CDP-diacylglycerol--glycerol-3-phosphate 3-phosphatidyltransferase
MSGGSELWALLAIAPFLAYFALRFAWYGALTLLGRERPFDQETKDRGTSLLLGQTVRQVYAWSIEPLVRLLTRARVRPNALTVACFLLSATAGVAIALGAVTLGGVIGFFGVSLDYFDGRIARRLGESTRAGGFLDSTLDRFGEVAFFSGAAIHFRQSPWVLAACLLLLGSGGIVSYTRAKAESLGIELQSGLMQRAERVVLFCSGASFGALCDGFLPETLRGQSLVFAGVLCLLAVLTTHTAIGRTLRAFVLLSRAERGDRPDR